MYLTRHRTSDGPRWALDGRYLPPALSLGVLLSLPAPQILRLLEGAHGEEPAEGPPLAPVDTYHEVWASGVTYMRSREARMAESDTKDVYDKVYEAQRPELFFKSLGHRAVGHGEPIRVRGDSRWNVPEPELVIVLNSSGEIVGYTAGDDVSSRDIEGENPLYLPQAKVYEGSCALGPGILLAAPEDLGSLPIRLAIERGGRAVFDGETAASQMKRSLEELASYLVRELRFPTGVLLMTGTGIVPDEDFTLQPGDRVRIQVGELTLENAVA